MAKKKLEETVDTKQVDAPEETINAGLMVSVRDVFKEREKNRQRMENERALRAANPSGSRISRLKVMADTPYYIKFLTEYDKGLELFVHMWRGDEPCNEICKVHYNETCDICKTVGSRFGETYHVPVRCFLGWVYNNVGSTFSKKDDRTGEFKTFNLNPIKLIQVPLGKDDANIAILQEASRRKYFAEDVWVIERKKGKGFSVPKTVDTERLKELLGRDVPLEISDPAAKITQENKVGILTMILSAFDNVQWEKLGLKPPSLSSEVMEITERKAPAGKPEPRKEIDELV